MILAVVTASSNSGIACVHDLLSRYSDRFDKVRAAFRSEGKADELRKAPYFKADKVDIVVGVDADQPETLAPAFEGAQCALIVTPLDMSKGMSRDHELSNNMIAAARSAGVKHGIGLLVYVGSWTVCDAAVGPIAARFLPTEALLNQLASEDPSFSFTILRSGFFAVNLVHMLHTNIKENNKIVLPANYWVPPVDPADIGRSGAAIMVDPSKHKNKHYDISGPEQMDVHAFATAFSKHLGRDIQAVGVPTEDFCSHLPPPLAQLVRYICEKGKGAVPCSEDVKNLTGSCTSFDTWLSHNVAAFQ